MRTFAQLKYIYLYCVRNVSIKQTKFKIMTNLQMIHNDPIEAINKLINTKDLHKKFIEIKKSLPLSKVSTTKDINEQSIKALLIMIDNGFIK